jgi:excisionase family DNA binding protein
VRALAKQSTDEVVIEVPGDAEQFLKLVARGLLAASAHALHQMAGGRLQPPVAIAEAVPPSEVMSADEVAEFLGVDRNTVYDYAGRGVIPHQRLGKRILFRRAALLSWLEGCRATSTRKG